MECFNLNVETMEGRLRRGYDGWWCLVKVAAVYDSFLQHCSAKYGNEYNWNFCDAQLWKLENAAAGFNPSETALVTEELSPKAVLEDFLNVSHKQHFASPFRMWHNRTCCSSRQTLVQMMRFTFLGHKLFSANYGHSRYERISDHRRPLQSLQIIKVTGNTSLRWTKIMKVFISGRQL